MSHGIVPSVSNMVHVTLLTALGYGIFVIHELRYYPHEPSYELCRRMESLHAFIHVYCCSDGDTFDVSQIVFPELLCDLHDIADSSCDPNVLLAFLNSKSYGPILIIPCEFYAQCGFPLC